MARTINERADELFLIQSAPNDSGEQWREFTREFINGSLQVFDFSQLVDTGGLRPHLFQEMPLTRVSIDYINKINRFTFAELTGPMDSISIPSVTTICPYAFWQSKNLKTLTNCNSVKSVGFEEGEPSYCETVSNPYGHVFAQTGIETLIFPNIEQISDFAFADMPNLKSIKLNQRTPIALGDFAFYDCPQLTSVYGNIYSIGQGCFKKCEKLEQSVFSSCSHVGYEAFAGLENIKSVVLGGRNLEIEQYAFFDSGVEEVYLANLNSMGSFVFKDCNKLKKVSVSVSPENEVDFNYGLFDNCNNLEKITIYSENMILKRENTLPPPEVLRANGFKIYVDTQELVNQYTSHEAWRGYEEFFALNDDILLCSEEDENILIAQEEDSNSFFVLTI